MVPLDCRVACAPRNDKRGTERAGRFVSRFRDTSPKVVIASPAGRDNPVGDVMRDGFALALLDQILQNLLGQALVDFAMSWDRLGKTGLGIMIDVVFRPVSQQYATALFQLLDEVDSLHATSSSPTRRIPGIDPSENSLCKSTKCSFKSSRFSPCVQ